jgi:hypothetical protein
LQTHTLNTSTNPNLNHPRPNRIRNIYNSLQSTTTLSIQTLDTRLNWKPSRQRSSSELRCATTWWKDRSHCDVFDKGRVDFRAFDEGFECAYEEIGSCCVFESAFAAFGEWCAEGGCYYYLERRLVVAGEEDRM